MRRAPHDRTANFRKSAFLGAALGALWIAIPVFAAASPARKKTNAIKNETELRLRLTAQGFEHLLKMWSGHAEFSQRTDMYFDTHENQQFLLRRLQPRAKLRLQERAHECVAQKSWIVEQHISPTDGFIWTATTRASAFAKHSDASETCRRQKKSGQFLTVKVAAGAIEPNEIRELEGFWSKQPWPKLDAFDSATAHLQGPLVPAAIVKKQRWTLKYTSSSTKTFKIQLGRDTDLLGSRYPENYELEVEVKDSSVSAEIETLDELSSFLLRSGLTPAGTNPQNSYDFFKELENLYAKGR
jgi:hypothetical protein